MVLVTGGTGLVGSHLIYQLLLADKQVVATHRESSNLSVVKRVFGYYTEDIDFLYSKITWIEADILDITSLKHVFKIQFDHVYHCAAMISFKATDYFTLRNVNIKGTANLVNLSLGHSVQKFCYVSSIAVLDEREDDMEITEANEWRPELNHHGYAISKYGAEMEVWRASQEGLDVIIVNPGIILGSGLWESGSGKLISSVAKGLSFYTEGVTGFVSVQDVVFCMRKLMESDVKNERYILVSENKTYKEILFRIADELGVKRPSMKASKIMTEVVWRLDWFKSLFGFERKLTRLSARSAHHQSYYSSAKVKNEIHFDFESVNSAIEKTCSEYRSENTTP